LWRSSRSGGVTLAAPAGEEEPTLPAEPETRPTTQRSASP
jgi:hypothetical protein